MTELHDINPTQSFGEIWTSSDSFWADYSSGVYSPITSITRTYLDQIYFLLYSHYGNSHINNYVDVNQWKMRVFDIINTHGPQWVKLKTDLTARLSWTEADILNGGIIVNDHTDHNGTDITASDGLIGPIDYQTKIRTTKNKLEAYAVYESSLIDNFTEPFIARFKSLFQTFGLLTSPYVYIEEE